MSVLVSLYYQSLSHPNSFFLEKSMKFLEHELCDSGFPILPKLSLDCSISSLIRSGVLRNGTKPTLKTFLPLFSYWRFEGLGAPERCEKSILVHVCFRNRESWLLNWLDWVPKKTSKSPQIFSKNKKNVEANLLHSGKRFRLVLAFSMLLSSRRCPQPVGIASILRGWLAQGVNSENLEDDIKRWTVCFRCTTSAA